MKKSYSSLIFFGSLILFIGVVISGISMFRGMTNNNKDVKTIKTQTVVPSVPVEQNMAPLFSFDTAPTNITAGQPFDLPILLNSIGKDVTGFDIVTTYDASVLDLDTVTTAKQGFDIFQKEGEGRVTITGIKQLGNNSSAVFANVPVVTLRFIPRATTQTTMRIQPLVMKDRTKIVDGSSSVTGQDTVQEITVKVQ